MKLALLALAAVLAVAHAQSNGKLQIGVKVRERGKGPARARKARRPPPPAVSRRPAPSFPVPGSSCAGVFSRYPGAGRATRASGGCRSNGRGGLHDARSRGRPLFTRPLAPASRAHVDRVHASEGPRKTPALVFCSTFLHHPRLLPPQSRPDDCTVKAKSGDKIAGECDKRAGRGRSLYQTTVTPISHSPPFSFRQSTTPAPSRTAPSSTPAWTAARRLSSRWALGEYQRGVKGESERVRRFLCVVLTNPSSPSSPPQPSHQGLGPGPHRRVRRREAQAADPAGAGLRVRERWTGGRCFSQRLLYCSVRSPLCPPSPPLSPQCFWLAARHPAQRRPHLVRKRKKRGLRFMWFLFSFIRSIAHQLSPHHHYSPTVTPRS